MFRLIIITISSSQVSHWSWLSQGELQLAGFGKRQRLYILWHSWSQLDIAIRWQFFRKVLRKAFLGEATIIGSLKSAFWPLLRVRSTHKYIAFDHMIVWPYDFLAYDHVTGSMKGIVLLAFGFSRILEEVHTCTNIILLNSTQSPNWRWQVWCGTWMRTSGRRATTTMRRVVK